MNLIFPVSGENYGGVDRFWFAHEDDISGIDQNGQLILKEGSVWSVGRAVKYSMEFQNPSQDRRGGIIFNPVLSGVVKKYRPELEEVLQQMRGERYGLIYRDKNGYLIQVGSPGEFLTFTTEYLSGGLPYENNGFRWAFRGQIKSKPVSRILEIEADNSTPPESAQGLPVILRYNGQQIGTAAPGSTVNITSEFTLEFQILIS